MQIRFPSERTLDLNSTPRACIAAARKALRLMSFHDLQAIASWATWCNVATFDGPDETSQVSLEGIVALYIACLVRGVEFPDGLDDEDDWNFVQDVWKLAPKTAVVR